MPYFLLILPGKVEFDAEEDSHVVGDCVKVSMLVSIIVKLILYNFFPIKCKIPLYL